MTKNILILALFAFIISSSIAFSDDIAYPGDNVSIIKQCTLDFAPCPPGTSCNITFFKANGNIIFGQMAFGQADPAQYSIINYTFYNTSTNNEKIPYNIICCNAGNCKSKDYTLQIKNEYISFNTCNMSSSNMIFIGFYAFIILIIVFMGFKFQSKSVMLLATLLDIGLFLFTWKCQVYIATVAFISILVFGLLAVLMKKW